MKDISLEDFSDPEASAEGALLGLFSYNDMKGKKKETSEPNVTLWSTTANEKWARGCVLAEAQNFARWLMETPSNHMTPAAFVDAVAKKLGSISAAKPKIEVNPRW